MLPLHHLKKKDMNLRVIKKDIQFLVNDFVDDCVLFAMMHPEDEKIAEVNNLIEEACEMVNSLFDRVNHPDKNNVKAWYKAINVDLLKGLDGLCDRLSAIAKK